MKKDYYNSNNSIGGAVTPKSLANTYGNDKDDITHNFLKKGEG